MCTLLFGKHKAWILQTSYKKKMAAGSNNQSFLKSHHNKLKRKKSLIKGAGVTVW